MKKSTRTLLFLLLLMLPLLSGCTSTSGLFNNTDNTAVNNPTTTTTQNSSTTATLSDVLSGTNYEMTQSELSSYLQNINTTDPVIATSIVMPNVVEVTVDVNYSYIATYLTFGGMKNETVTDTMTSKATAFFINEDGYMVTNAHVVNMDDYQNYPNFKINSETVTYNFADSDQVYTATIVDYNTDLDLAVLKSDTAFTDQGYLTFFNITPDNPLYYGENVIAVGNANGDGMSVTSGVISAPLRNFNDGSKTVQAIQTDAAINEGNSGGPLTNLYGSVVGIDSFKIVTQTSESLGYAIPSNIVIAYLDDLGVTYHTTSTRAYTN